MSDSPIFIIGTERSGSNLLRLILNAHSRISVPHPPHIMNYFGPIADRYGDLHEASALEPLVDDIMKLMNVHIYPWEFAVDREQVIAETHPRTLYGVVAAIYEQHQRHDGKARWGCKSTFMIHHVDAVLERNPDARFIWLIRDPRDVAVSSRKSVFSPFHPALTAELWLDQQAEGLALMEKLGEQRVLRLHYESLTQEAEKSVRKVCDFLDETFEPGMLRFFETKDAQKSARLSKSWENTGSPILTNNSRKYLSGLSQNEIRWVECITGELMDRLGYERELPVESNVSLERSSIWTRWKVRMQNMLWNLGVEWNSLRGDSNHWRRWARGSTVALIQTKRQWGRKL